MSAEQIEEIARTLKIPMLVHFTRIDNLLSILQNGLIPVDRMASRGVEAAINDHLRLDGRLNGVSTSVAFPNAPMFYKLRNENPEVDWCVLGLHPAILWRKKVLFCKHNAADARISCVSSAELRAPEAFAAMFNEIEDLESREDQKLKAFDPTDVQAEVLVLDEIEPKYIGAIFFTSEEVKESYASVAGNRKLSARKPPKGLFANRKYHRTWG